MYRTIGALLLFSLLVGPVLAVDQAQAIKDWREGAKLAKEFYAFSSQGDFAKDPTGFVPKWKEFNARFEPFWKRFLATYGTQREQIMAAFRDIQKPLDVEADVYSWHNTLLSAEDHTKNVLRWCTEFGQDSYRSWARGKEQPPHPHKVELYLDYATRALAGFEAAKLLDPASVSEENLRMAREAVAEGERTFEANLSKPEMQWPGNNAAWRGEGSPDALCAAAFDYLLKNPDKWDGHYEGADEKPLAICLASDDWNVWKTNILQQPTCYSLDFQVAFAGKAEPRLAYMYHYTFYTKEEAGIPKAPPFDYANAHQYAYYKMLRSAVPGGGGGSTTEGAGRIFWLALIAANVLAGLLAAAPLLARKAPALSKVYDALTPLRNLIGVVALAVAVVALLRTTLLHFAPLADILPQLTAAVAGLFLGKELLMKKMAAAPAAAAPAAAAAPSSSSPSSAPGAEQVDAAVAAAQQMAGKAGEAAENAARAAQELLISHKEQLDKLEAYQVPVGVACLVTGVLHLLVGSWPLF